MLHSVYSTIDVVNVLTINMCRLIPMHLMYVLVQQSKIISTDLSKYAQPFNGF